MNLVPPWLRKDVEELGKNELQELRLRVGRGPELVTGIGSVWLNRSVAQEDINFTINIASRYSPWAAASIENGYITAQGGHRVGVCGEVAVKNGKISAVSSATSVSLRVARDFPGISGDAVDPRKSTLIIGRPGTGKTTLMRDAVRRVSNHYSGAVAVVDERRELFPIANGVFCFPPGERTDVLSGCSKRTGIETVLRTMNPHLIAVDEITAQEDCTALLHAGWCGVTLLATAHAASREDLLHRKVYEPLIESRLFQNLIILRPDKSWIRERMEA